MVCVGEIAYIKKIKLDHGVHTYWRSAITVPYCIAVGKATSQTHQPCLVSVLPQKRAHIVYQTWGKVLPHSKIDASHLHEREEEKKEERDTPGQWLVGAVGVFVMVILALFVVVLGSLCDDGDI